MAASREAYDLAIVGGGVAGMYTALRVLGRSAASRQHPPPRIVIVAPHCSQSPSPHGGRLQTAVWHGVQIQAGAGVVRPAKDRRLLALARFLGVPVRVVAVPRQEGADELEGMLARLLPQAPPARAGPDPDPDPDPDSVRMTFRDWAAGALGGKDQYRRFVQLAGYTDYEGMGWDAALRWYGFDDWLAPTVGLVDWSKLLRVMARRLARSGQVRWVRGTATRVRRVDVARMSVHVRTAPASPATAVAPGLVLAARHVVLAVPASAVRAVLGRPDALPHTRAVPWCRVYALADPRDGAANEELHRRLSRGGVPATASVLQKMNRVGPARQPPGGRPNLWVYQVAYADSRCALQLAEELLGSPAPQCGCADIELGAKKLAWLGDEVARALRLGMGRGWGRGVRVRLRAARVFYWPEGTHFTGTGDMRQWRARARTAGGEGVTVVGEAVGPFPGWTEGALWSVDAELAYAGELAAMHGN
jgi:hypothetical protein